MLFSVYFLFRANELRIVAGISKLSEDQDGEIRQVSKFVMVSFPFCSEL
jgi:hypothetical protein